MKDTIERVTNARCTGCAGCFNTCPEGAIDMVLSREGFYRPVVNHDLCTDCGLCLKRCPELSWRAPLVPPPAVYAAWSTNDEVRVHSSSGGVFSELARRILDQGGAVAGCAWNERWEPEHVLVDSWDGVARLRGSKYIPSRMGSVIRQIETLATNKEEVLFCGTPCQVAAVDIALSRKARAKVVLADLVCHGLPSLKAFRQYVDHWFGGDLQSYEFRAKTTGWSASRVRARTRSGRSYDVRVSGDPFQRAFQVYHVSMMEACYDCRFQGGARAGDVTLGDFWGVPGEWRDDRGVSVVLANTAKGRSLVEEIAALGLIELHPSDFATAAKGNPRLLSGLRHKPLLRSVFMRGLVGGIPFPTMARLCFPWLRIEQTSRMLATPRGRRIFFSKVRRLITTLSP
ncbi:MAG: Coenzyme F420 hydrogenase/dehydrogenase, beta subunit C-terminal domain [Bradymonadales bacterium]|nr:Coenzyme F420 hydrogenase/dehydrogenase, beta subunit C-terminal domain [Bradymonadales bacterium]